MNAPEGQKARVASRETDGIVGGALGAPVGTGLATIGVGLLFATPPGWVAIAAGAVGAIVMGYGGSEGGRWAEDTASNIRQFTVSCHEQA